MHAAPVAVDAHVHFGWSPVNDPHNHAGYGAAEVQTTSAMPCLGSSTETGGHRRRRPRPGKRKNANGIDSVFGFSWPRQRSINKVLLETQVVEFGSRQAPKSGVRNTS